MADMATIQMKMAQGIPLDAAEQQMVQAMSGAPQSAGPMGQSPILNPAAYGLSNLGGGQAPGGAAQAPAEQQFTPQQLAMLSGMASNQEEQGALSEQMQLADSLRNAKMAAPGGIRMSSGTSYTPANTEGEMWANILQQGIGHAKANRIEQEQKRIRDEDRKARKEYMDAVINPKTPQQKQMADMIGAAQEGARARAAAAPAAPLTVADKLRKFRKEHMTI